MSIIGVIIVLIIIGFLLVLLDKIPIDPTMRWIIRGVVILLVVLWLINLFVPGLGVVRPIR